MTKLVQHSFLGGQLDWEMMGRQDVEKYQKGATLLRNVVLHKRGAAFKRPGTNFVSSVSVENDKYRLIPFAYTSTCGFALLFTNGSITALSSSGSISVTVPASGFTAYSGDELSELDYCQCGDVVYIAHRNHPPAMIRHTVSNSTHAFALSIVDFASQQNGIPTINSATVSKTGITTRGPSYTEEYKVTAVFGGIETYPSNAFYNKNCNDFDGNYCTYQEKCATAAAWGGTYGRAFEPSTKTYAGTSYTLPWTESQKITLDISITVNSSGESPEQVRIYRKSGSFFGLVGIVEPGAEWTEPNVANSTSGSIARINYNGSSAKGNALNAAKLTCDSYGLDVDGFTVTGSLTLTLGSAANKATVNMKVGHIAFAENDQPLSFTEYDNSPDFSTTSTYAVGDRCKQGGYYWKCRVAVDTPGNWTGTSNWTKTNGYTTLVFMTGDKCWRKTTSGVTYNYVCKFDDITGEWDSTKWTRSTKTSIKSRTYTYRPCGTSSFTVRLGNGTPKTVNVSNGTQQTLTVSQTEDETESAFKKRADQEATVWANGLSETELVSTEVRSDTASASLVITPSGSSFVLYNVTTSSSSSNYPVSYKWEDKYYTPDVSVTPPAETDVMSEPGDYPGCVCLSQQRLIWASTINDPSRVFMSEIGAFYTHSPHDVQIADDPIDFQVSLTQFPNIRHMAELRKIVLFNESSEWIVDSASANSGITYETIRATQHSCIGSSPYLKPIVCNNVLLFAERTGQAVREYGYELDDDGFGGNDISVFSQSIFNEKKIVAWAYQQHPHSTCWCVLSDGTLASLTFNREQQCIAWATHVLGGGGFAKDIVCTQGLIGNDATVKDTSEIFILVKRNGLYCIEQFRPEPKDVTDTPANFVCMDAVKQCTSGSGDSGTTIVNTNTMQVVSTGGSGCVQGYPFDTRITTVYPVVANEVGMSQMDVKCVQYANLRLMRSVGGYVKAVDALDSFATSLVKTVANVNEQGLATIEPVDERVILPASESRDGRITIFQNSPYPFGVTMVETDIDTEENKR